MEFEGLLNSLFGSLGFSIMEIIISVVLLILLVLLLYFLNQLSRYKKVKKWIKKNRDEMKRQEEVMDKIEKEVAKYKKAQEGLEYWSNIREELGELSKLPSITEEGEELILRLQISKSKKEQTDVTATENEININIYEGEIPVKCTFHLMKEIDPHKLTIKHEGNTLEIRAPKV